MKVTASAPGKLMLFGEHSVVYGYPCLVTAVNQRLTVTVEANGESVFSLKAPDLGLITYSKTIEDLGKKPPKSVRFVETLYKIFLDKYPQKKTIKVTTKSDFSSLFGFGSSSAVTVAFAKALTTFYGINLSKKELFDLCYQAVIAVQGVGSGFDLAAAIWGGTIYYIPPAKVVRKIKLEKLPLLVGYTGVKADTPTLVRMVAELKNNQPARVETIFQQISQIVKQAAKVLEKPLNLNQLGKLIQKNQTLLKEIQVSSQELNNLIWASQQAGAYGAKLAGAGGGDCMFALADEANCNKIKQNIKKAGGHVMDVELNAPGVKLEEN